MEIPETKRFIPKGFELGTTLSSRLGLSLDSVRVGSCIWIEKVLRVVHREVDITEVVNVKVRGKLVRNNQGFKRLKCCISISPVTRVSLLKFQNGERAQWEGK